uniref:G_PROTEIN_RECEP_F1_2 domain-containing protein n=1 Tax=Macrostomum lignano TaxID=282301 RepID=A0A1I8FYJ6_9PLAT
SSNSMVSTAMANSSENSSCSDSLQLDRWSLATALALGLISFATVFGNSLVLLAVLLHTSLRSTTVIFVSNLAVADLLLGACVLPLSSVLEITHGCWLFGPLLCDLWASIDVLCCTASIMSLCAISMDRYVGVTRPLQRGRIVSKRRACVIVLCVWLLSGLVSVGPLIGWRDQQQQQAADGDHQQCAVSDNPSYIMFSSLFSFYLPLGIVVFFYIRVYQAAARQTRFLASGVKTTRATGHGSSNASHATASDTVTLRVHRGGAGAGGGRGGPSGDLQLSSRLLAADFDARKKQQKTLGIVVGVFIVCWLPFFFLYPFKWIFCKSCAIPELAFKVAFWLGYCNSLCNPVIYACWNRDFRRAFGRILTCQVRRANRAGAQTRATAATGARSQQKPLLLNNLSELH